MTDNLEERRRSGWKSAGRDRSISRVAKLGKRPPLSKGYRHPRERRPVRVNEPNPTGRHPDPRGSLPARTTRSAVKFAGEKPQKGWAQRDVDLRRPRWRSSKPAA